MQKKRMWLLFWVLLISVGLDQWTKYLADQSLGTYSHPLLVEITEAENGKTAAEVLKERFNMSQIDLDILAQRGAAGLTALDKSAKPALDDKAFANEGGKPRMQFYWAFHHRTFDMPPRRIPLPYKAKEHFELHEDSTVREYMKDGLPYLSDAVRDEVLDKYLFRAERRPVSLAARVKTGDLYLVQYRTVNLIDKFLQLKYAENPGAAWGFMSEQSENFRKWFFLIVSVIAVLVISIMFHQLDETQNIPAWAFAVILSGAVGNFIDRLRFNYVIDFIDMYVGESHWPTYNVADIAITIGVALLILEVIFNKDNAFLTAPAPKDVESS